MTLDILVPHTHDLGAFTVKRVLPSQRHPMVGPFIFFDHIGPARLAPGLGMNVRPHPHIGLATVTYLFEGSGLHRDSLGTVQEIRPGDVNWMVAGRGIVHSERTPEADLATERLLHGIQLWVALPEEHEDDAPSFTHVPGDRLPRLHDGPHPIHVILGSYRGNRSDVPVHSPMVYAHVALRPGEPWIPELAHEELALYAVDGSVTINGDALAPQTMAVLNPSVPCEVVATGAASCLLLGGKPFPTRRWISWNFVATSRDTILAAQLDWTGYPNERFAQVPDETEFIPLPDRPMR